MCRGCNLSESKCGRRSKPQFVQRVGGGRVRVAGEGLGVEMGEPGELWSLVAVGWAAPRDAAPAGFEPIGDFRRPNLQRQGA